MPVIARVRVALTGVIGLPGVCTFYGNDPIFLSRDLNFFWASMAGMFPAGMTATVDQTGDFIEATTGQITSTWINGLGSAHVSANGPTSYAAPAGAAVTWLTDHIVNGHRAKGRTFIVPLWGSAYENDGSLTPASLTNLRNAATALVAAAPGNFVVWSRPVPARAATPTLPARVARLGSVGTVVGSRVTDKVAVLRSRRD